MFEVTYGETKVDFGKLPAASQFALVKRGLAHFLGNEQASKVVSHFKNVPDAGEADKTAYRDACVKDALAALHAGTVGNSVRGPRGSAVETIVRQIAVKEIKNILGMNKLKMPKAGEKVTMGNGQSFTGDELIARRLANPEHGPRIQKEAEAQIKADARKTEKLGNDL